MSKNIIRKVMLMLLLMSILNAVFAFDLVEAEQSRDGEAGTVMSPSTLDESVSRENSKHPSILELRDEKNDPSDSCTPFDCSLSSNPPSSNFINVSVADAKGMIESIEYLVLVDVRNSEEYLNGHIENAVHIPLSQCELRSRELSTRKALLVYCRCGIRSIKACRILAENGFENVYNMLGGIKAWEDAGYPLTSPRAREITDTRVDVNRLDYPVDLCNRTEIMEDDLLIIRDAISEKGAKWTADETSVSRLTFEERRLLCGAKFGSIPEGAERLSTPTGVIPLGTFDWRNVSGIDWMTSVKDQGACGSCWAFGTLGSMEAVTNIVENDPDIDLDLSEQFLVSCCDECGDCGGGWPDTTYDFIKNTGVPDELCFPYVASDVPCNPCSDWADRAWFITNWIWVSNDPDSIKWALQTYGPLGVAMRSPDDFLLYKSGIYEPVWSSPEWDETFPFGQANHWVTLVGYNDTEEYWIVKNSWGSDWGEEGYGKIAYGVLETHDYILAIISVDGPMPREHDLRVSVQAPPYVHPGSNSLLNATVYNNGLHNETDVELFLLVDGTEVNNVSIPELVNGTYYTIDYLWTPTMDATYNVTAYATPVPGENVTVNNIATKWAAVTGILVYTDDYRVDPSHRYPVVALDNLGITYVNIADDPSGFGTALASCSWSLVIVSHNNYFAVGNYWNELEAYVLEGGRLILSTFDVDGSHSESTTLWSTLGVEWISDMSSTEPVYRWDPTHPIFTIPNEVGDLTFFEEGYLDNGDHIRATTGTAVAGFTSAPSEDSAAIVLGARTVLMSFILSEFRHDEDADGKLDAVELWENAITYISTPLEHELMVSIQAPSFLELGDQSLLNATVRNLGLNNETDVELFLFINGSTKANKTISKLVNGTCYTINYTWTPTVEAVYNITAYVPPVAGENVTANNVVTRMVLVQVFPDILVVNDDDGSFWINGTSLLEFELALMVGGYDYWVWNESSMSRPPLDFMVKFNLVIWTCGDYWNAAVDLADAVTLQAYLAQGGNILLEGEDIGYDHGADSFMVNVAHAIYEVDDTGAPGLTVTDPSHPVTAGLPTSFTWQTYPPYDDGVSPTNGGAEVIQYTGTTWTAVTVFEGASNGSVVYYAFPLYCLAEPHKETLAINSINWLLGIRYEHELAVALEAPDFLEPGGSSLLNATVYNRGLNNETDVELLLMINGTTVANTTIAKLVNGTCYTINHTWTPTVEAVYNVTACVPPVPGENITANNVNSRYVIVSCAVKILAYVQYTDYDQEYANALIAIESTFGPNYLLTELWDYTQLDSVLSGNDILFIPEQENADLYTMESIGATWSTTLSNFMNEGGVIILCDHTGGGGGTYGILTGAALMSISGSNSITGSTVYLVDPSDALAEGVSNTFIAPNGALSFITAETNVVFNDGTYPVVIHKTIDLGHIALIGFDYYASNPDADQILGNAVGLWIRYEHDITVSLEAPTFLEPNDSSLLNVTVCNGGLSDETDVELFLFINGIVVDSITISDLESGDSCPISYTWTPTVEAVYNITAYVPPVAGENVTANNIATKMVNVRPVKGYVLFDQTHGTDSITYYSVWVANLTHRGYVVDSLITSPIAPSMLEDYNIFVIPQAHDYYSSNELSAIQDFVSNGGGLLVIGDDEEYIYTDLTSFTGIDWISGGTSGVTVDITPHPVTENVSSVYLDAPIAEMLVTAPAIDLVRDPAGGIMLAVYELAGRVIGFADEGSLWDYGIHQEDNLQLANNMINWLLNVKYSHELVVTLETPSFLEPGGSVLLNATVCNRGLNNETDVELLLMINGTAVANATISKLVNGTCHTINHTWTPTVEAVYNITAYTPPVAGENITANNVVGKMVYVHYIDVALISDYSELLAITGILNSIGIGYDIYNDNSMYLYTENLSLLLNYPTVIFYQCNRLITSGEHSALQSYLSSGGNLLITGYDSLGSPSDTLLADVVRSSSTGDNVGEPDLYVVDASHPIMSGPYGSFPAGYHISGLYSDCDAVEADVGRNAVTVAELADGYDKIIATDLSPGKVVYWNGVGPDDWTTNADCEAMFKNTLAWFLIQYEHELVVDVNAPNLLLPGDSWLLSATVCNRGLNNETDVKLFLIISDVLRWNETTHELLVDACFTINYLWTPLVEAVYNVTAYAPPVSGENVTTNNVITRLVHVRSLSSDQPVVYVNPHVVTAIIGEPFTVAVNLFNVTEPFGNLYGFDVQFAWNPAIIEYVSHTITVPVEEYPDGVLHEPILPLMETVESDHVWFAYASMQPAEPFNNPNKSNSIFLITFKAVGEGTSELRFTSVYLANVNGQPIVHSCIDGLVTAGPPTGHDVAVINVSSCADTVYTGRTVNITVLAANEGIATETFNVTLYANSTVIGVQTLTLYRGENATLTFGWNTTGLAPCSNFTILAKASQVPFETNIVNNICFNGWIRIKMLGDLNGDDIINIYDIVLAAVAYNSRPGDPNWNPEADVAQPYQHINILDIVTISSKYGQTP